MDANHPDWTRVLGMHQPVLPAWVRHNVRELGPLARDRLAELLRQADPENDPYISGDHGTSHVLALLAECEPDDALVEECVALVQDHPRSPLAGEVVDLLVGFGPRVAPAVVAAYGRLPEDDPDRARHLIEVLARCGARDERTFATILDALKRFPAHVADLVGHYGDVRAVEPLRAYLASEMSSASGDDEDPFEMDSVFDVKESLAMLGTPLTDEEEAALRRGHANPDPFEDEAGQDDRADADEDETHDDAWEDSEAPYEAPPRPLPNAPCRCGSGRKYKKCHMAADEAV